MNCGEGHHLAIDFSSNPRCYKIYNDRRHISNSMKCPVVYRKIVQSMRKGNKGAYTSRIENSLVYEMKE